jgi:outer membrane protein TolC
VPIFSQNQTIAILTFTQPITPLFAVRQAVRIARADERIALAKAAVPVSKKARDTQLEETYFKLLIAQRRSMCDGSTQRAGEVSPLIETARAEVQNPLAAEDSRACGTAAAEARELAVSLNREMGWPDDTELELLPPDPLVESISLEEIADKAIGANPEVILAEQNVVKARAASAISKMAYFPVVAAVGGYMFQNAIPAVPSNFGYGGVIASWNLFDFGKREHGVKESRAQLEMAELAVQLTRAKVAADVKKSFLELQRSRQLSKVALRMGSSMAMVIRASRSPDSAEVKAARAEVEVEMLEADFAHRQAFNRLVALAEPRR